jgi:pimeloyl-ACP methyl ester carboxylesterase
MKFVDACGGHEAAMINYDPSHFLLQQMEYLAFIDIYHDRIKNSHLQIIPDTAHAIHDEKAPELAAILNGYLV